MELQEQGTLECQNLFVSLDKGFTGGGLEEMLRTSVHKGPPNQSCAELQQLAVGAPIERVAVDIMRPFPCTNKRKRYVLAAFDYFT